MSDSNSSPATYLTVKDVAARLKVSEKWVRRVLVKAIARFEFGGQIRFLAEDLQQYEQDSRVDPQSPRLSSRKPARQQVLKHLNLARLNSAWAVPGHAKQGDE